MCVNYCWLSYCKLRFYLKHHIHGVRAHSGILGWCPKWFEIRALVPAIFFVPCFYVGIKKIEKYFKIQGWQAIDIADYQWNLYSSYNMYTTMTTKPLCYALLTTNNSQYQPVVLNCSHLHRPSCTTSKLSQPLRTNFHCCIVTQFCRRIILWKQHLINR